MTTSNNYSADFDFNFYSMLNADLSTENDEDDNSSMEDEHQDDEEGEFGWSQTSWERGADESDEDYEERKEDLENFTDGF